MVTKRTRLSLSSRRFTRARKYKMPSSWTRLSAGREDGARKKAGEDQGAGLQLHLRLRIPDRRRSHVLSLLRISVRISCAKRAAYSSSYGRNACRVGFAGQGLPGMGKF